MFNRMAFQKALERAKVANPRLELRLRLISVLHPEFRDPDEEALHYQKNKYTKWANIYRARTKKIVTKNPGLGEEAKQQLENRVGEVQLLKELLYDLTHDTKLSE